MRYVIGIPLPHEFFMWYWSDAIIHPLQVLTRIFSCLRADDVNSCRLICRKWYWCCESESITSTEKFVFRSPWCTTNEINEFLLNRERLCINVEFVNIDLTLLKFHRFGSKIKYLRFTNCFVDDRKRLRHVLSVLPNMTHLDFRLDENYDFKHMYWGNGIARSLVERGHVNNNLEEFEYHSKAGLFVERPTHTPHTFSVSQLHAMFPGARRIYLSHLWERIQLFRIYKIRCWEKIHLMNFRKVLPESNITELPTRCYLRFDGQCPHEFFTLFSRFVFAVYRWFVRKSLWKLFPMISII